MGRPASDKKDRLIKAAINRFHSDGYANTSLTDLAADTGISSGNTYYYFKAKGDLAKAVIDTWCKTVQDWCAVLDQENDPMKSILSFIKSVQSNSPTYVLLGCPIAALNRDLINESEELRDEIRRVYPIYYSWLEAQFKALGFSNEEAVAHSRFLMAGLQGAILLCHAQQDESLLADEVNALSHWLKHLQTSPPPPRKQVPKPRLT